MITKEQWDRAIRAGLGCGNFVVDRSDMELDEEDIITLRSLIKERWQIDVLDVDVYLIWKYFSRRVCAGWLVLGKNPLKYFEEFFERYDA